MHIFFQQHLPKLKNKKSLQASAQGQCRLDTKDLQLERSPSGNSTYKKLAVLFSANTFVVNQSLFFRINICGEIRHLRQAQKPYQQPLKTVVRSIGIVRASGSIGLINLTHNIFRYELKVRLKIL